MVIVFSFMICVSEVFDYGIGNFEYFVWSSMIEEEVGIVKENFELI